MIQWAEEKHSRKKIWDNMKIEVANRKKKIIQRTGTGKWYRKQED
jgi:hypothetical protein